MKKLIAALTSLSLSIFLLSGLHAAAANDIPMTIDGVINCAHPDNAITTTCRGEAPPAPAPTPAPTPPPAPEPGVTITYSGNTAIN
jgi:hypothetical protein